MLSIFRCRELVGKDAAPLTDLQIAQLRDQLYALAETAVELARVNPRIDFAIAAASLTSEVRADVEERAAIAEFDGKLTREQAERLAFAPYVRSRQ